MCALCVSPTPCLLFFYDTATGGYLTPANKDASPATWDEHDDHGAKFASFQEVRRQGNCRKCMTLVVLDPSRSMYVRATPDEFAWSMDQVQWNTIASGKWVTAA